MKPFEYKGKRMFPQEAKLFGWLKPGEQFKTKNGATIYTVTDDGMAVSETESKYFPHSMPVTPVKHF